MLEPLPEPNKPEPPDQDDVNADIPTVMTPLAAPQQVTAADHGDRTFTVLHLHGVGGNGVVSLAQDHVLERTVAIKQIRADHQDNAHVRERFLKEAKITGQLEHPGIVPIHGLERDANGGPFLVMRFIQGRTMAEAIAAYRKQPSAAGLGELVRRFEAVCQTLAYAHSRGVVHRDLKPTNIMIGDFGETLVLDWGLAKIMPDPTRPAVEETPKAGVPQAIAPPPLGQQSATNPLTVMGHALGTPGYMAPEQARGEDVDERADVFGLGAILCQILTGKPAVPGPSVFEVIEQTRDGNLSDAHERLQKCNGPAELVTLATECLAARREDRPRHAGVVATRLAAYLASVQERLKAAEMERAKAEAKAGEERKRRRLVVALAAALILLITSASLAWLRHQQEQAARLREAESLSRDGQHFVQSRQFAEAEIVLNRGLQLALALSDSDKLADKLTKQIREAEVLKKAADLHELASVLNFHSVQDSLPQRGWHVLDTGCRYNWDARAALARPEHVILDRDVKDRIRDDLLSVAILWGDLQVRLARPAQQAAAHRAALDLLVEAEKLFGPNVVLLGDQVRHARALGRDDLVESLTTRLAPESSQTAWDHHAQGRTHLMNSEQARTAKKPDLMNAELAKAAACFDWALKLPSPSFSTHFLRGVCAYRRSEQLQATNEFSYCIGHEPRAEFYYYRGLAQAAFGDNDSARRDLESALEPARTQRLLATPAVGLARVQLGLLHAREKRWDSAIAELTKALDLDVDIVTVNYQLGRIHAERGDRGKAIFYLEESLKLRPDHEDSLNLLKDLRRER